MPPKRTTFGTLLLPVASIGFLARRPRLMGWVLAPFLINIAIMATLWAGVHGLVVVPLMGFAEEYFAWLGPFSLWMMKWSLLVAAFVASAAIAYLLFAVVSAPFNDFLTERVEGELLAAHPHLQAPPVSIPTAIGHALRDALLRLCIAGPLVVLAFLLGFIPLIGPLLAGFVSLVNGVTFLSVDAYSYSMDRRRIRLGGKLEWLRARRDRWLPLGVGMAMFAAVPCSLLLLPMLGSVAATRLFCEALIAEDSGGTIQK